MKTRCSATTLFSTRCSGSRYGGIVNVEATDTPLGILDWSVPPFARDLVPESNIHARLANSRAHQTSQTSVDISSIWCSCIVLELYNESVDAKSTLPFLPTGYSILAPPCHKVNVALLLLAGLTPRSVKLEDRPSPDFTANRI